MHRDGITADGGSEPAVEESDEHARRGDYSGGSRQSDQPRIARAGCGNSPDKCCRASADREGYQRAVEIVS